jgi:hypothetical protein
MEDRKLMTKKDAVELTLIDTFSKIGMDRPENFDEIVQYVYDDVDETADDVDWNDSDVMIGFRRWIESNSPNHGYFK